MSNPYSMLKALLPTPEVLIGVVTASANGVVTLELPDGTTDQARGAGAVDDVLFFKDRLVEGAAPTLAIEYIDI